MGADAGLPAPSDRNYVPLTGTRSHAAGVTVVAVGPPRTHRRRVPREHRRRSPNVLTGAVVIKLSVSTVRVVLQRVYPNQPVYVQLGATLVTVVLWFGAILGFLSAIGLPGVVAALGTASGFLALGVSYALSEMLADAVAGIYLLRDPDFNPGDRVTTGDVDGVIASIELRKTGSAAARTPSCAPTPTSRRSGRNSPDDQRVHRTQPPW